MKPPSIRGITIFAAALCSLLLLPAAAMAAKPSLTEPEASPERDQATLTAKINPEGSDTHYHFDWATDFQYNFGSVEYSYNHSIPLEAKDVGSGTGWVEVSQTPKGLRELETYHYRIVATNSAGTTESKDHTFYTGISAVVANDSKSYPLALFGEPSSSQIVLNDGNGPIVCTAPKMKASKMTGGIEVPTATLVTDPVCTLAGVGSNSLQMNGCKLSFHLDARGPGKDAYSIGPAGCGPLKFTLRSEGSLCKVEIPAQTIAGGDVSNSGSGEKEMVAAEIGGALSLTTTGFYCGKASSGSLEGTWNFWAAKILKEYEKEGEFTEEGLEIGEQRGIHIDSAFEPGARINASEYPAPISGEQKGKEQFRFGTGEAAPTLLCSSVQLAGPKIYGPKVWVEVEPTYAGCEVTGLGSASVKANSCSYTVGVEDVGLSYPSAAFGIVCFYEGTKNLTVSAPGCTMNIGTQEAAGVGTASTEGSGTSRTVHVEGSPTIAFSSHGFLCGLAGVPAQGTGKFAVNATLGAGKSIGLFATS